MTEEEEFEFRLRLEREGASAPKAAVRTPPAEPASPIHRAASSVADNVVGYLKGNRDLVGGMVRGAGSLGATILAPLDYAEDALWRAQGVDRGNTNDQRRSGMGGGLRELGVDTDSLLYQGGKLGGEIAGTAGVGGALARGLTMIPGLASKAPAVIDAVRTAGMSAGGKTGLASLPARMTGGAVAGGGAAALVNPDEAGAGAAIGTGLPVAGKVLSAAGKGIGGALRMGENSDLARTAINKYGIPVGLSDVTQSRVIKAARSIMNDAPITGGIGRRQIEGKQAAFNRAVGDTFGAAEAKLTPEVLDAAKQRMGGEFDRIWNGNALQVDPAMVDKMMELRELSAKLPRNEGASLAAEVDDLFSKMVTGADGALTIPGEAANKFQSYLRRRADSSSGLKNELSDLRQSIIATFNKSVSPQDAEALTRNRGQYKAFKTVEPLLNAAETGVAGRMPGDVPAALLPQAVNRSYKQAGGVPLAELSQIGSRFLVDRTAQTGGSARAAMQNGMIGAMLGVGAMSNPVTLGSVPLAAALNKVLGSPAVARRVLSANPDSLAGALEAALPLTYRTAPVIGAQ